MRTTTDERTRQIFSNNLKEWMNKREINQAQLSKGVHASIGAVSTWVRGLSMPSVKVIAKIAEFLMITPSQLLEENSGSITNAMKVSVFKNIDLNTDFDESQKSTVTVSADLAVNKKLFAFHVANKLWEPEFRIGDVVVCERKDSVLSGTLCIVSVGYEPAKIKRVQYVDGGVVLLDYTSSSSQFFSKSDIELMPVKIYGQIIRLVRNY